jgi:hypothetical protein
MKLYCLLSGCSPSPRVVTGEAGIPIELSKVDLKLHQTADGLG